ncbi:hypothetical protein F4560_003113 [Saccharothrix ecbatanensis]|uniref:Uncharacterized protein n=1 Tax=Saccharothrix ecbatanensis TaxID=1105145 RepID=A0A7W9HJM4_9PSEU|nr:hypothetical protein [Saccharothrix ecbatanensis]MBB5803345.1 hypothetical protein [Saccharothrix ecbatanensis]
MVDAALFGVVYALGVALVFWVLGLIEAPVDLTSAGGPADLIQANRALLVGPVLVLMPVLAGFVVGVGELLDGVDAARPLGIELDWAPQLVLAPGLVSALAAVRVTCSA